MGSTSFYGKQTSIHFVVKNIASSRKKLAILNIGLGYNQEKDLMAYPEVSEAMIKESLIKGELANKIRVGDLTITATNIDLTTFDEEQKQFLTDAGCNLGYDPSKAAKDAGVPYIELGPLDDEPPANSFFFDVDGTPSYTDSEGEPHSIGSGGGLETGPYEYIEFEPGDTEGNPSNSISIREDGAIVLTTQNNGDRTIVYGSGYVNAGDFFANGEGPYNFNYQNLDLVGHPIPEEINLVPTVGWSKAALLNALDITIFGAENQENDPSTELQQKPYQAVAQLHREHWVVIQLPETPSDGDIVDIYIPEGASCLEVQGQGLFGGPSVQRFKYDSGYSVWRQINFASIQEFFIEVNRRAIREASNIYLNGMNFSIDDVNAGNLTSTVNGNCVCLGDIRVMSDTTIKGDLIVIGQIINESGFSLNVHGNLITDSINFNPVSANGEGQGNLIVKGDLICQGSISFNVERFTAEAESFYPAIDISGNLIVEGTLAGDGGLSAPALYVEVGGNAKFSSMTLSGGDSSESFGPQNGGELYVAGDLFCSEFRANGGRHFGSSDAESDIAGHGGILNVDGSIYSGSFELVGGAAPITNTDLASGGQGGTFTVKGDAKTYYIDVRGGDCASSNGSHVAGSGGQVNVGGDLLIGNSNALSAQGGTRTGDVTIAGQDVQSANGGQIEVFGNIIAVNAGINFYGGDIQTTTLTPGQAGAGGSLRVYGDFIYSDVNGDGGDCSLGQAGDGGSLIIYGDLTFSDSGSGNINLRGGNGNYNQDDTKIGQGGNGGNANVKGNISMSNISTYGGTGYMSNGGNGGDVICGKFLEATSVSTYGGNCTSSSPANPGAGGNIDAQLGIIITGDTNCYAGTADGTVTAPSVSAYGNDGGDLVARYGNICVANVNLSGGSLSTTYYVGNGGNGGQCIASRGFIQSNGTIASIGGNSNGGDGGNGGEVWGANLELNAVILNGGSSIPAPADNTQGVKGSGGTLSMGNGRIGSVTIKDGDQGNATANSMGAFVGGHSSIGTIDMDARTNSVIEPYDSIPVTLVIGTMANKNTLNSNDGTETNALTELDESIFKYSNGTWSKITGTSLMPG